MNILPISTSYNNKNNNTQSFKALKIPQSNIGLSVKILKNNGFKNTVQETLKTASARPENDMLTRIYSSQVKSALLGEKNYGTLSPTGSNPFIIAKSKKAESEISTILGSNGINFEQILGM